MIIFRTIWKLWHHEALICLFVYLCLGRQTCFLLMSGLLLLSSCSVVFDSLWPHVAHQASLSSTISRSLPKFISIEAMMLSNHLILCWPIFLLPSVFPSIRVFPSELALCIRWSKYWSFSFSISPAVNIQDWSPCSPGDSLKSSPMSQIFPWGSQSTGASALASFLPKKSQG